MKIAEVTWNVNQLKYYNRHGLILREKINKKIIETDYHQKNKLETFKITDKTQQTQQTIPNRNATKKTLVFNISNTFWRVRKS